MVSSTIVPVVLSQRSNSVSSRRHHSYYGLLRSHSPAIQHRAIRSQWLGFCIRHRHGGHRRRLRSIVRRLGVQVFTSAIPPMALSQRSLDHWVLPTVRHHVYVILVSLEVPRRLRILLTICRCWNGYFGNYLQVVHRLSITTAGYVLGSYGLGAAVMNPIIGG